MKFMASAGSDLNEHTNNTTSCVIVEANSVVYIRNRSSKGDTMMYKTATALRKTMSTVHAYVTPATVHVISVIIKMLFIGMLD